jgi:RNA polymerase sigma-70 factor (ECF subfamily)
VPEASDRDEDLVRRFLTGDRGAFAVLVERHERRVFNIALRMTGREEDARDATQDAFLTALRKLSSFRGEAAFTTWLHRVTVNACYDLLRKRRRAPLLDHASDDRPEPEPPPAPDHADRTALSVDVQRALLQVPLDYRAVMILHDVQDLPQEEVSAILGIPIGTVKSRLHRGRISLARALSVGPAGGPPAGPRERPGAAGSSDGTMAR